MSEVVAPVPLSPTKRIFKLLGQIALPLSTDSILHRNKKPNKELLFPAFLLDCASTLVPIIFSLISSDPAIRGLIFTLGKLGISGYMNLMINATSPTSSQ